MASTLTWAVQWTYGYLQTASISEELKTGVRDIVNGLLYEIILNLTIAQEADKGHYPEIADVFTRFAHELSEYAGIATYLSGEYFASSFTTNVKNAVMLQQGKCQWLVNVAKSAKAQNLDALHDYLHFSARDVATLGMALEMQARRYLDITSFT